MSVPPQLALLLAVLALTCCKREERELRLDPPVAAALDAVKLMPNGIGGTPPPATVALGHPCRGNAYQLAQGKRLFERSTAEAAIRMAGAGP